MLPWLFLFSSILAGLLLYLEGSGSGTAFDAGALPIAGLVVLSLLALYAIAARATYERGRGRRVLNALSLLGAAAAVAVYVGPRIDAADIVRRIAPQPTGGSTLVAPDGFKSVRIRKNGEGRFVARGDANGVSAEFLIDTGASAVILRQTDAERAGIDTRALSYSVPIETANGQTKAAAAVLRTLAIGAIEVEGLEVLVASPGSLNESLLGMTFLRRLRSYEIAGDFITLRE